MLCFLRVSLKYIDLLETSGKMSDKLNLFMVLSYFDRNNMEVYSALREDENMQKELQKNLNWMLPQWMSGCHNDEEHRALVDKFNEMCNEKWFDLYQYPELQAKLLACCGLGKKVKHRFFKPSRARSTNKILDFLSHKYPDIREEEAVLWCKHNDVSSMKKLAQLLGYQEKDVKDLEKSFSTLRNQL